MYDSSTCRPTTIFPYIRNTMINDTQTKVGAPSSMNVLRHPPLPTRGATFQCATSVLAAPLLVFATSELPSDNVLVPYSYTCFLFASTTRGVSSSDADDIASIQSQRINRRLIKRAC